MKRRSFFKLAAVLPVAFWAAITARGRADDDTMTAAEYESRMSGEKYRTMGFRRFMENYGSPDKGMQPSHVVVSPSWDRLARQHKRNVERFGFGLGPIDERGVGR